jgi:ADP-ribose pyrophosphatase YjhB (NUDIX family)
MTLGARALMVDGEKVFLIRHTYVAGWHFPGGGVEPGETMIDSLHREVLEESGHRLTGEAELFGIYLNRRASPRDHVALYICRDVEKVHEFEPGFEIAEAGWFALDALPEPLGEGTRARLDEFFDGAAQRREW